MRFTPADEQRLRAAAEAYGQSLAALTLHAILGLPLPRTRRPRIEEKRLAEYLAAVARSADAIRASLAELGKSGSNLNQIAHNLNAGFPPERLMNALEAALQEHARLVALHEELLKDAQELRTIGMRAGGYERRNSPQES